MLMGALTGTLEIPRLLSGTMLDSTTADLGSQRYAQNSRTVVAAGGCDNEVILATKRASDKVMWLRLGEV
jgi:hypothetical protein